MVADCHFQLRRMITPGVEFRQCYRYGTSKKNQRIESWWQQMSQSALTRWREYFQELERNNEWDKEDTSSNVALLAVYMPILRRALACWVSQWNRHRIRRQHNRPYVVPGQPWKLYHYPPQFVTDYRQPVRDEYLTGFKQDLNGLGKFASPLTAIIVSPLFCLHASSTYLPIALTCKSLRY